MKPKPDKVEEPTAPYVAKQAVKGEAAAPVAGQEGQVRYIAPEAAKQLAGKIFEEHDELFRKLAQ